MAGQGCASAVHVHLGCEQRQTGRALALADDCHGPPALECWVVPRSTNAMQTADVVIVGGGIVGSSIAYHLTANGCRNVLVIERETAQGKGSTGKSMGGVRAQFSTPVNIQMSLYSIPFYASFDERLGYPVRLPAAGLSVLRHQRKAYGIPADELRKTSDDGIEKCSADCGAKKFAGMFPQLRADDIVGGSFCSTDGFVDPYSAMIGFMSCGGRPWRHVVEEH